MLFFWLRLGLGRIVWLFRYPSPRDIARIRPASPCPVCGTPEGKLRCVARASGGTKPKILCRHTCAECGAKWFELPIVDVNKQEGMVEPSTPRDELEKFEDSMVTLQTMRQTAQPKVEVTVKAEN